MKDKEPTEKEISQRMKSSGLSYYEAREELRDEAYKHSHSKPDHQSWGDYWKSY